MITRPDPPSEPPPVPASSDLATTALSAAARVAQSSPSASALLPPSAPGSAGAPIASAAPVPSPSATQPLATIPLPTMHWMGAHRIDLESCGSTNDEAARLARAGARHGTVVTSLTQSSGRGRAGRTWASPPGGNLYVSMILRPALPLRDVPAMTLAIGVAVCEVAKSFGAAASLKWPNDVLVGGRKVAGILLESQSRADRLDVVIAGIGVNLSTLPEPEEAPFATSLAHELGEHAAAVDRELFLARLLQAAEHWVDRYVACGLPGVIPAWHANMAPGIAAQARIEGAMVVGTLEGIDATGALLLRDADGAVHRVIAGEVETLRAAAPSRA